MSGKRALSSWVWNLTSQQAAACELGGTTLLALLKVRFLGLPCEDGAEAQVDLLPCIHSVRLVPDTKKRPFETSGSDPVTKLTYSLGSTSLSQARWISLGMRAEKRARKTVRLPQKRNYRVRTLRPECTKERHEKG